MKIIKIIAMSIFLTTLFSITAFAEQKITYVSVFLYESKSDEGTIYQVEPKAISNSYEITNMTLSKDYEDWKPGIKVTYELIIEPKEGFKFDTSKVKNIYLSNGEVVSKKIRSKKITIKVNYIPKVTLENPTNIYYEDEYVGVWDKVDYCKMYEVEILKEDDNGDYRIYKTVKVTKPKIDLSFYATDDYSISFKVRAVAKNLKQSKYLKSSNWVNANDSVYSDDNTTSGNFSGSGNNLTFKDSKGKVSGWQHIGGSWYYFNPDNKNIAIVANWLFLDGHWYYFNDFGVMQIGWINVNEYFYYLNPISNGTKGALETGWICTGPAGPWYYLQTGTNGPLPEGAMYAERITPDGYYVDAKGEWRKNVN